LDGHGSLVAQAIDCGKLCPSQVISVHPVRRRVIGMVKDRS
jgi:hypothetical protein